MEHQALYRQFRPMTFNEVVEQEHVVHTLRQAVLSGQIAHAYLFSGTRGTGKTSVAKILARAVNCLDPREGNPCNSCEICKGILDGSILDVIEMDAASNNSVDNIRRICDEVLFMPSRAKYKVYIVDEVHMLSTGAFNALLKTLEEPPKHAVFILATTEPHRIPATILSRCQRYDFRRIPFESIVLQLRNISEANGIIIQSEALEAIAGLSDGALRDAISLLDQIRSDNKTLITREDVLNMTGVVDDRFLHFMARAIINGNYEEILDRCNRLIMEGRDVLRFTLDLSRHFRDLLVISISDHPEKLVRTTSEALTEMKETILGTHNDTFLRVITRLSELASELKWSPDARTSFEIALLALGSETRSDSEKRPFHTDSKTISESVRPVTAERFESEKPKTPDPMEEPLRNNQESLPKPTEHIIVPEPIPEPEPARSVPNPPPIPAPPVIPDNDMFVPPGEAPVPSEKAKTETEACAPEAPLEPDAIHPVPKLPTPNLTRAGQPVTPVDRPVTNLSKVTSVPPVREAHIPASVPSSDEHAASHEDRSAVHLWEILIKRWEETMVADSLQMRHARISVRDSDLWVVFPDIMRAYIDELTGRNEYKRIREDALALFGGVTELRMITDSDNAENYSSELLKEDSDGVKPDPPDWVRRLRMYSEQNGIEFDTIDGMD